MNYANLLYSVGSDGIITDFDYSIPINTLYASSIGGSNGKNPHQFYGDTMVQRLWMNGVPASSWQQTDAAFSALPNGTTLYAGDIIEVPAVWKTSAPRYSFYNVAQEGTTGTLNSGATTCTTGIANWITVSSVTGLIEGQHVTCGSNTNMKISHINAANPAAVLVYAVWSTSVGSPVTLSYSAPVLGPEIQLPTKAAGAPSSGAFIQGDVSQNSSAAANGVAMYVNTAAGSPGTFNGVPLGNSTGQINTTQISNTTGTGGTAAVLATAPTITNQTDVGTSATVPCPRTDYGYGSGNGTTQYCKITGTLAASPTNNTQKVTIVTTSSSYPGNQMALDIDLINLAASAVESSHWKIIGDTTNGFNVSQSSQEQDPLLAGSSKLLLSAVTVSNSTTFYFYVSSTNTVSGQNWQADIASYNYSTPNIASITVAATQSLSPTRAGWAAYGGTAAGITGGITNAMLPVVPTIISSGSISTLAAPSGVVVCTTTCAVTIPTPAAGNQFCVRNVPGSATVITLNAMGASTYYELTTHAGWGTANHTLVSGGVATDQICLTGYDSTHYMVASFTGTWTD
jgi:hypothetical protein